ncbi:MAG TPA: DUF488 family protein [Dehalococcoidia bacterium]
MIRVKRAYDPPAAEDGRRVLVDRLWPRGLSKEAARLDAWLRDAAPSDGLRRWFGHRPERWEEFRRRYREELAGPEAQAALRELAAWARDGDVTLLFAAKDPERNNAVVLREVLRELAAPRRDSQRGEA